MPTSNTQMIYKLQVALNSKGMRVLNNRSQFFSEVQNRPVTIYKLMQSRSDGTKNRHVELFSTPSQIQMVLFMRNLWYTLNGQQIPKTNGMKGAREFNLAWKNFAESELQNCLTCARQNLEEGSKNEQSSVSPGSLQP